VQLQITFNKRNQKFRSESFKIGKLELTKRKMIMEYLNVVKEKIAELDEKLE
jgi:hypothetical protein